MITGTAFDFFGSSLRYYQMCISYLDRRTLDSFAEPIITQVMCYDFFVIVAESKLTSQGQISVPSAIRKKLGLAPGSILEWYENEQGEISVKRASKFNSADIHGAIFEKAPEPKTVEEMDESIRTHFKQTTKR